MASSELHYPDCNCSSCLALDVQCCGKTFTTWPSYRRHQRAHEDENRGKRKHKATTQVCLVPDGLGYLQSTVSSPQKVATVSLAAVIKFVAVLNSHRKQKFTRANKRTMQDLQEKKIENLKFTVDLPADQAHIIYSLAKLANCTPGPIANLLVSYGLEYLALELRKTRSAPTPKDPGRIISEPTVPESAAPAKGTSTQRVPISAVPTIASRPQLDATARADSPQSSSDPTVPAQRTNARRYIP